MTVTCTFDLDSGRSVDAGCGGPVSLSYSPGSAEIQWDSEYVCMQTFWRFYNLILWENVTMLQGGDFVWILQKTYDH